MKTTFKILESLFQLRRTFVLLIRKTKYPLFSGTTQLCIVGLIMMFTTVDRIYAQSSDLTIQIVGPDQVFSGQDIFYEVNIANNGPYAVNNALFFVSLPDNVSDATFEGCSSKDEGSICPSQDKLSISNLRFNGVLPFLPVNGSVTMKISMKSASPAIKSSFSCIARVTPPMGIIELDPTTATSIWNTSVLTKTDILVESIVSKNIGSPCEDKSQKYDYTIRWINNGPAAADGITLSNTIKRNNKAIGNGNAIYSYNYGISDLSWNSSKSSISPTSHFSTMGGRFVQSNTTNFNNEISRIDAVASKFYPGDTITLNYSFNIKSVEKIGCERNVEWTLRNESEFEIPAKIQLLDTIRTNNKATVDIQNLKCSTNCHGTKIKVEGFANSIIGVDCDDLKHSYDYTIKWINVGSFEARDIELTSVLKRNNMVFGKGNAEFIYEYEISDLNWSSSLKGFVPYSNFSSMNGNFVQSIKSPFSNFTTINNTIPNFMPYDTIILTFRLNLNSINKIGCNRDIEWVLRNESYFGTNSSIAIRDSIHSNNKNVIDISNMSCSSEKCKITDISVENHVSSTIGSDCNSFPISYDYTIKWINNGPSDADGILLTNLISRDNATNGNGDVMYTYNYNITDLSWSSSHSSKVPSSIFRKMKGDFSQLKNDKTFKSITRLNNSNIVTTFKVGDTITLRYTLNIEDLKVFGCGNTITWDLQNEASFKIPISLMLLDSNSLNNSGISFVKNNSASSTDLAISKMVYPQIASTGDKVRMTIMFQNASKSPTSPAIWIDTIPSSFQIDLESINCKSIFGSSGCGEITYNPKTRVLSQYIDTMNANSALEIIFDGTITALYTATESNRVFAVHPCHDCHPSTNLAQTNYQINGVCDKRLAGSNRDTTICNSYYFPLNLSNFLSNEAYRYGSWARISGSGGWFDNDASILTPDLDMTTNIFRYIVPENAPCPEDTSYITLRFDCQDDSIKAIAHSNFNNIKIEWIKEKEKNIDYFEVHRSVDGISFYKIAEVEGRGTTDKLHSYIYIDNDVKSGVIYYYQIKQVNLFGEELLSNIVSSSIDNKDFIVGNLYPNPTDNYFNLSLYSTGESDVNISILSSLGQEIISKSLKIDDGNSEIHFDNLQRLAQGGYYVLVNTKYGNFTKTLAIARE